MEPLLASFVAAALAEIGDKTQLLAIALAARYRAVVPVILGIIVAAAANSLLAAAGGTLVSGMITIRAISLLVAVSLLFVAVAGFIPQLGVSEMGSTWRTGAFVTTAVCFFLLEFGDKTQFLTFGLAAQFNSLGLAAAGATAGVAAANLPVLILGDRFEEIVPVKKLRRRLAILFLLIGLVIAVNALRLV